MSHAALPREKAVLTADEFLALPDDGRRRWLLEGKVYPAEPGTTVRNWRHSQIEARIAYLLIAWLERHTDPRGRIHSGEAGFRLRRAPDSLVGVDVAYVSAELAAGITDDQAYYDGAPILAVEILSPSDLHHDVVRKVRSYLEAGTVAWAVDPDFQVVHVHRPGRGPESFNAQAELTGGPELPGFRARVADIFAG